ncbi:MAG TPA: hypothetical protein VFI02_15355 [Armatimonadota bacterium]|nr:hypothetical protein [Armatimonadota bacterium]
MRTSKAFVLACCIWIIAASAGQCKAAHPGTIRGTVVYTFNNGVGSKPDIGTQVFLVAGKLVIQRDNYSSDTSDGRFAVMINGKQGLFMDPPENPKCAYYKIAGKTVVDGNGNYSIAQVKPGTYTIILYSNHTSYLTGGGLSARDLLHRVGQQVVTLKPGQTIDCSHDFQMDTELTFDEKELALKGLKRIVGDDSSE